MSHSSQEVSCQGYWLQLNLILPGQENAPYQPSRASVCVCDVERIVRLKTFICILQLIVFAVEINLLEPYINFFVF